MDSPLLNKQETTQPKGKHSGKGKGKRHAIRQRRVEEIAKRIEEYLDKLDTGITDTQRVELLNQLADLAKLR